VNTSPAFLFRKVSDPDGAPTLLYNEIDTVFGPRAKDNEDIRGMLNAGHRKGAMAGRCVVRGNVVTTELSTMLKRVTTGGRHLHGQGDRPLQPMSGWQPHALILASAAARPIPPEVPDPNLSRRAPPAFGEETS
jgi:hypothetical protein